MSEGRGVSESGGRRKRSASIALLNCIIFFGFGLSGQGVVLGAEEVNEPLILILSTDLEAHEELGGSQGVVLKTEATQIVEATDSSMVSSKPVPGIPLVKAELPAAAAFAASPLNVSGNTIQPADKIAAVSDGAVVEVLAGRVQVISGEVRARDKVGNIRTLHQGDVINEGDTLATSKAASAQIRMEDGGLITLRPETRFKFDSFKFSGKEDGTERSFFSLYIGGFRAVTGLIGVSNKQSYRITTPVATIGVIGTDHEVVYLTEDVPGAVAGVYNKVNAGATILTTDVGSIRVGLNQMGYAAGMYKLPQIQPVILSLFTSSTAPDSDVKVSDSTLGTGTATTSVTPSLPAVIATTNTASSQLSQSNAVTQTNAIALNGEAQKNGEVKYSEAAKPGGPVEVGSLKGFKFGLAPIYWGGDLTETLVKRSHSGGTSSFQNSQRVDLRAASYIWQPWLARVRAGIGVVRSKDTSSSGASGKITSGYTSLVGSGALALLPQSRYPFEASFRVDDSRTNYSLSPTIGTVYKSLEMRQSYRPLSGTSSTVATYGRSVSNTRYFNTQGGSNSGVNSRWGLRHTYQPLNRTSKYGVGYDRNVWNTAAGGGNASWGLQGNFSTSFDKQSFGVDARRSESYYSLNGADLSSNGIVVRHNYRRDALLAVASSASVDQSAMRSDNSYNTRYLQAGTYASWQPDQDLPLYVNASGRIYDASYERLGVVHDSQNQVVSAGARYAHTRNLSYALDGTVANSKSDGVSNRTVTENGSIAYTADIIKFGDASYNRNAHAGIGFQSNTNSPSNRTVTGGIGHGLGIPYLIDGGWLDFNVNQSLLARNDKINGQNRTLSHTGSMSWRPAPRGTLSGAVIATVSDIRNVGGDEQLHYQAASLGVNALNQTSANSTLRAFASLQWTSNGLGQYSNSANANVEYKHARAFDVKGLRYDLSFNTSGSQSRDSNPQTEKYTTSSSSLDQSLDYRIGRANVRLSLGLAKYGTARSKVLMLHLGRNFGNL